LRVLYLVQHGEAKPEHEDPARPLTDRGRADVEAAATLLARLDTAVDKIIHSGKTRAVQTAEIMAAYLKPSAGVEEFPGISPLDDPSRVLPRVEEVDRLMLCGHLPHLSRLAALLITGDSSREVVRFRMGGVVCLVKEEKNWLVAWAITPEQAQKLLKQL